MCANRFAAAGYVVLSVNPRGSTGRGQEFCEALFADWGGPALRDVLAAVNFAIGESTLLQEVENQMEGTVTSTDTAYAQSTLDHSLDRQRLERSFAAVRRRLVVRWHADRPRHHSG